MPSPAHSLPEARARLDIRPLMDDSPDYVDLSEARGSNCLRKLEVLLQEHLSSTAASCHLAFVGHRGSGKSTELRRLEHRLSSISFPVHLTLDSTLHEDADYPDLLLWLVESVANRLKEENVEMPNNAFGEVAEWFQSVTRLDTRSQKAEVETQSEIEASAGASWWGNGLKILARIKAGFVGSRETRQELRQEIKKRADQLITAVNTFLIKASDALEKAGKPHRLLIVQDNLDRLSREAAMAVFSESAELLQQLVGAFVWTAPVGTLLAPFNLANRFEVTHMPMISVLKRGGSRNQKAVAGLTEVIARRMEISLTFEKKQLVTELIKGSGGSVRELLRFTNDARVNALADGRTVIEAKDIHRALTDRAVAFQNSLSPTNVYFPILVRIAKDKDFRAETTTVATPEAVNASREFFHTLIREGAVLAYNGDGVWYDINPALKELPEIKRLIAEASATPPS